MKNYIFVLLLLLCHAAWAQSPKYIYVSEESEQINEKNVKLWSAKNLQEYAGSYHLGMSEGEWDLIVMKVDSHLIMQTVGATWGKNEKGEETFLRTVQTFDTVDFKNARFRAGDMNGFFAVYAEPGKKPQSGIVLTGRAYGGYSAPDTAEFGGKNEWTLSDFFNGRYALLSYELKSDAWFKSKPKDELQIMRNEIYARYGFRFVKGGKMDVYFRKTDWYVPQRDHVNHLLNEIERRNIEKIIKLEK